MKTFINLEEIDILYTNREVDSKNAKEDSYKTYEKAECKQSVWTKITSGVKKVWGKVKPVISGLTVLFTSAATLLRVVNKFRAQCKNMKGAFA